MKRSQPLKADPAKVREWQQRSRQRTRRPKKVPPRYPTGELTMSEWREAVFELCEGKCVITGAAVSLNDNFFVWSPHHVLKQQLLRRRGVSVTEPKLGIVLSADVHRKHTDRFLVVTFEQLPAYVVEFAASLGPWAEDALLREHPRSSNKNISGED